MGKGQKFTPSGLRRWRGRGSLISRFFAAAQERERVPQVPLAITAYPVPSEYRQTLRVGMNIPGKILGL